MSKIRYIKQRDRFSCVPVCVINILKHHGFNVTYDDLGRYRNYLHCRPGVGTYRDIYIPYFLERFYSSIIYSPKLKDIDDHIDGGGIVAVSYTWKQGSNRGNHTALIVGRTPKYYKVVNYRRNKTVNRISRKRLCRDLRKKFEPDSGPKRESAAFLISEW